MFLACICYYHWKTVAILLLVMGKTIELEMNLKEPKLMDKLEKGIHILNMIIAL